MTAIDPSEQPGKASEQAAGPPAQGGSASGKGEKRVRREAGFVSRDRRSLTHRVRYALRHPRRVPAHARRVARDTWLQLKHRDHISYYRAVMAADTARSPEAAVGHNPSVEKWERMGRMQFEYLLRHGLEPRHRMLEIGCGNLRAGRLFIDHLDTGNYYGIDISPAILMEAQRTLAREGLQAKLPHLALVADLTFSFLPAGYFDVVHAHSVFSHSPPHVIEQCLAHVGRVLAPGGYFDFTFGRTDGPEHQVLHEDFYYRTETLVELARKHGLSARLMDDWEDLPHRQSKIRATVAEEAGGRAAPDVGAAP
ncbi:class I SAM-dependent methyltransferase [Streptomyces sp. SP18BB07]|uniref:class I SAM-dependent methyltransferase n=1 Tax=Streptomyces sp. SP18BB07 TaxID=3002522 RepID=UPI002E795AEC|nr:class I SAM-dependent methyltransferase [Streptomyces sp. SP18BB07]MEE1760124.1 class I SAM-dependent methyltransferase [Streptomyces sp. SP18BB07]